MKRIIFFCLFMLSYLASFSQETTQTLGGSPTQANKVKGRLYVDSALYIPLRDTVWTPLRMGAQTIRTQDSLVYVWVGFKWHLIGAATSFGTVTLFSKTDNWGITSSVTNATTTPNHSITVDSATLSGYYLRLKDSSFYATRTWAYSTFALLNHTHIFSQITDGTTAVRNLFSAGTGISYNSSTGVISATGSVAVDWGDINGTLSNQTDLQAELDAKVPTSRTITTNAPLTGGGDLSTNRTFAIDTSHTNPTNLITAGQLKRKLDSLPTGGGGSFATITGVMGDNAAVMDSIKRYFIAAEAVDSSGIIIGFDLVRSNGTRTRILYGASLSSISWGDIIGTLSDQTDLQTALDGKVNNTGNETIAGIKTYSSDPIIPDEAYDATAWNGSLEPPTKNAIRDKIESMGSGGVSQADVTDTLKNYWRITGNSVTPANPFIGTTNDRSFWWKTNNTLGGIFDSTRRVGIFAGASPFIPTSYLSVGGAGIAGKTSSFHGETNFSNASATSGFYRLASFGGWEGIAIPTFESGTTLAMGGIVASQFTALRLYSNAVERLKISNTETIINETGADNDTRIEGDTDPNLLTIDAGLDAIGVGATPGASVKFGITSTTKGFLPPSMSIIQRDAISSPATGLIVYNNTTNKVNWYNGSAWRTVGDSADIGSVSSSNIANTSLTANNDYTQSWAGYRKRFDSVGLYSISSKTIGSAAVNYTTIGGKALKDGVDIDSYFDANDFARFRLANANGTSQISIETNAGSKYSEIVNNPDLITIGNTEGNLAITDLDAGGVSDDIIVLNTSTDKVGRITSVESTYNPTATGTTNIAGSTTYDTYYKRMGNVVTVWGDVSIDATAALTISEFALSLPVASNLASTADLSGSAAFEDNTIVQIKGDATNDRAMFRFTPQSATNNRYSFSFTYKVL